MLSHIVFNTSFTCQRHKAYEPVLTKISAAQNEVALSYHKVRGLYFLAVNVATTIATRLRLKSKKCVL